MTTYSILLNVKRTILFGSLLFVAPTFAQAQDAANGEQVFKKCMACHAVGPDAKVKVGPALNGIVGAKAGAAVGYKYSESLVGLAAGGLVWSEDKLDAYLKNPKEIVPNGKMAFAGLAQDKDRKDVIAYLKQFKADGSK